MQAGVSAPVRSSLDDGLVNAAQPSSSRSDALPQRSQHSQRSSYALGGLLVLGVVLLWVAEVKVLQVVKAHTSWDKPYCVGIALKGSWIVGLLPVVLLPRILRRWCNAPSEPPPHSLQLSWSTVGISVGLSILVQAASITWVASLASTSPSVNSAIYQASAARAPRRALPRPDRPDGLWLVRSALPPGAVGASSRPRRTRRTSLRNAPTPPRTPVPSAPTPLRAPLPSFWRFLFA